MPGRYLRLHGQAARATAAKTRPRTRKVKVKLASTKPITRAISAPPAIRSMQGVYHGAGGGGVTEGGDQNRAEEFMAVLRYLKKMP